MNGTDIQQALDFQESVGLMLDDPDLTGNLLTFAIALAGEIMLRRTKGQPRAARVAAVRDVPTLIDGQSRSIWRDAAFSITGGWNVLAERPMTDEEGWAKARSILRDDVPRYGIDWPRVRRLCVGTMLRPAGAPCKRNTSVQASIPNPFTGERRIAGACTDVRHRAEFDRLHNEAWAAWHAAGDPQPANNRGGILERYFTCDWPGMYRWADPTRYTPGPGRTPTPPKTRLALVTDITSRRPR